MNVLEEKATVKAVVADLAIVVLWNPTTYEAEADTELHHIKVWKEKGCVLVKIEKVR